MNPYIGSSRPYLDGPHVDELRLVAKFPYLNFGEGCCFHFQDRSGRVVVWFSKRRQQLEVGDRVRASFVVKTHEQWNGTAQNITKLFKIMERL